MDDDRIRKINQRVDEAFAEGFRQGYWAGMKEENRANKFWPVPPIDGGDQFHIDYPGRENLCLEDSSPVRSEDEGKNAESMFLEVSNLTAQWLATEDPKRIMLALIDMACAEAYEADGYIIDAFDALAQRLQQRREFIPKMFLNDGEQP